MKNIQHSYSANVDSSITTNFVLFDKHDPYMILRNASWTKININAGTAKTI